MANGFSDIMTKMAELEKMWPEVNRFFKTLNSLFGEQTPTAGPAPAISIPEVGGSISEQILGFVKQAGRALSPNEIKKLYVAADKTDREEKILKRNVQSTLSFLKNRKKLLGVDEKGKYFLK